MTLATGTKLGRYEIRSKIGEGGMGEVYLAEDTKLDRKAALKILPADVKDQAFTWLEKDPQQHSALLTTMTWFFTVGDLRSDPRYADLVRRMGLRP